jgi:hypothetical protein
MSFNLSTGTPYLASSEESIRMHQQQLELLRQRGGKEEAQPKRPNSAFNIFFQVERQRLISKDNVDGPYTRSEVYSINLDKAARLEKSKRPHRKTHGRITFVDLAKTIAQKWKDLDSSDKRLFEERANDEKRKYAIELEDYLLRQVPSQHVKKRLSSLRRGSLGKYIKDRQHKIPSPTSLQQTIQPIPATVSPTTSDYRAVHSVSPSSTLPMSRRGSAASFQSPGVETTSRSIHVERARNLERLYQMQIQLYEQQMLLHAEVQAPVSQLTFPPVSVKDVFHHDPLETSTSPATHDVFGLNAHVVSQTFDQHEDPTYAFGYAPATPFHDNEEDEFHNPNDDDDHHSLL